MVYISKNRIMDFYKDNIGTKEDLDFVISELKTIFEKEQELEKVGIDKIKEFDLASDSWQVVDSDSRGHYTFVEKKKWYDNVYMYIFKQEGTNWLYAIDKDTLKYLITYKDFQDYMFVYVGSWGDYRTLSI